MAGWTNLSAAVPGMLLIAACAGGPVKTAVPAGLAYDCDRGGSAMIRYSGGGFLPGSNVVGTGEDGRAAQVPRSTATLSYDGATYHLVAEWTDQGLRYRARDAVEGRGYLVWTQHAEHPDRPETWTRPGGPRGGEDARIGWRPDAVPAASELPYGRDPAEGSDHALCRRAGRGAEAGTTVAAEPHHR